MLQSIFPAIRNFLFQPLAPTVFGWYRIGTGLVGLLLCALLYPGLYLMFGQHGLVIWDITDSLANPMQPTLGRLYKIIGPERIHADALLYGFFWLYAGVLVLFTLGWQTRITAILAWIMHLTLMNTSRFGSYGVESMLNLALFYSMFFPCGAAWAIGKDRLPAEPEAINRLFLRVLQIQMCIIYASAGIEKCFGAEWWNGNAIWFSLTEEQFRQLDFTWIARAPLLAKLAGWTTLLIECGYSICIWIPRIRRVWLIGTLLMHAGIGLFMGLHTFALIMIVLNLSAFGHVILRQKESQLSAPVVPARLHRFS